MTSPNGAPRQSGRALRSLEDTTYAENNHTETIDFDEDYAISREDNKAQPPEYAVRTVESEDEEDGISIPARAIAFSTGPATPRVVDVNCVCEKRARKGDSRLGKCQKCKAVMHLSCRARKPTNMPFTCFTCPDGVLETVGEQNPVRTRVNRQDTTTAQQSLPATRTPELALAPTTKRHKPTSVPPAKVTADKDDSILCICPVRSMKERVRLAKCLQCGRISHISCFSRRKAGVPHFLCVKCEGILQELTRSDHPSAAGASGKKGKKKRTQTLFKASYGGIAETFVEKTREVVKEPQLANAPSAAPELKVVRAQTLRRDPAGRHNLKQQLVPNMKDRPTRRPRRSRLSDTDVTERYDSMFNALLRKARGTPGRRRTTDLHEAFLRDIPIDELWRHYCILPDGHANAAVRRATEIHFVAYRVDPIMPAPQPWIDELTLRLKTLLDTAKSDGQGVLLSSKQWQQDAGRALGHVRYMAVKVLHHGSFEGKRIRLGLLAELLGLCEKGRFWMGGDEFAPEAVKVSP